MSADDKTVLASEMKSALAPHFYSSPEIFAEESRKIFHAEWFCIGRMDQISDKGEVVYPNLLLSAAAEHIAAFTLWPKGPDFYAPMADPSLDIRRYLARHLGDLAGIPKD